MSVKIVLAEADGIVLETTGTLGFPAAAAKAIAASYKDLVAGEPVLSNVKLDTTDGREDPLAVMLGMVTPEPAVLNVYPLGEMNTPDEGNIEMDMWTANTDGIIRIAFNGKDTRDAVEDGALVGGFSATLVFPEADLDEVLELLGTDLTDPANFVELAEE